MIENLETSIQILTFVGTLSIGFFAFRLSRFIAKNEAMKAINNEWNEFTNMLLIDENLNEFNEFFLGDPTALPNPKLITKQDLILFRLLNIMSTTFHSYSNKTVTKKVLESSFLSQLARMPSRRAYLIKLCEYGGYDEDFIFFLDRFFLNNSKMISYLHYEKSPA